MTLLSRFMNLETTEANSFVRLSRYVFHGLCNQFQGLAATTVEGYIGGSLAMSRILKPSFLPTLHLNIMLHDSNMNSYSFNSFCSLIESHNYFSRKTKSWFVNIVRRSWANSSFLTNGRKVLEVKIEVQVGF